MTARTRGPVLVLAALCALATTATGQDDRVFETRIFDVTTLVDPAQDAPFEPFGPGWGSGGVQFEHEETEPVGALEIDALLDVLRETIDPDSWDEGAEAQGMSSGKLVIRQTKENLAKIAAWIDWMNAALRRRVDVQVHWILYGPESVGRLRGQGILDAVARGSLAAGEVRGLLVEAARPGNRHESGSASSTLGRRVAVRRATHVAFLGDYDVEIAQAAQIGDPIILTGREGMEAYVRPQPLSDGGRIALQVLLRAGKFRRPMPVVHLEATELGTLDMPEFETVQVSASAVLREGRTLASAIWSPRGADGPALGVLLVTPRRSAAPPAAPDGMPAIVNGSFLSYRPEEYVVGWYGEWEEDFRVRTSPKLFPLQEQEPTIGIDELVEITRMTVDPDSWDEDGAFLNTSSPGLLWLQNRPEVVTASRRFVGTIEAQAMRTVRMDFRLFSVPAAALASPDLAPGSRPDEAVLRQLSGMDGAREIRRAVLDAIVGRWACCQAGVEWNYVHDYDVEVAQEARISDPIIGQVFDGLLVNAQPFLSPNGGEVTLRLGIRLARIDPESVRKPRRTDSAMNGVLHHPRERAMRYNGMVTFPRGGCHVLDAGADEDGRRLVLVMSAR